MTATTNLPSMPFHSPGPDETLPEIAGDWLDYMTRGARRHGGIVRLEMPRPLNEMVLVTDPQALERIFIDDAAHFKKPRSQKVLAPIIGSSGLLLGEGETWKRHRRIVQPAFHRSKIAAYATEMTAATEAMLDGWESGPRDVFADATKLTFQIAVRTLFGSSVGPAERIHSALAEALEATNDFLDWRRMQRVGADLKAVVDEFIAERRRAHGEHGDILSMLLEARDEDGAALTDAEVRDEAINAFVGGVDTTAIALSWTLWLLAQNPEIADRVAAEVARVIGPGPVEVGHVPALKVTDGVIKESLRLYPPAWNIAREVVTEVLIGGYPVTPGTQVYACPYLVHRSTEHFPEPERFLPERWTEELTKRLPRFAYFPFGGGQRMCIGSAFATMELAVVLATVVRRARFAPSDRVAAPRPSFTLRPRDGVHLDVAVRGRGDVN